MEFLADPQIWISLLTLTALEIVLGIDNIIFISILTAVGMASQLWIMVTAVVIAMGVMLAFSGAISDFVHKHPTLKMLALSFLILIGVSLMAEGLHQHISKGYIYFAMAFSCAVELINLKMRSKSSSPVELRTSLKE